jgi:hypothetical protein
VTSVSQEVIVFVASPADCAEERRQVREVADAVSHTIGSRFGMRIRVTGWENVQPDYGRPQALINPLVDECDVFVGILSRKWGSPTGSHASGFSEEFERAVGRRGDGTVPHIAIYFSAIPPEMEADPGPELQRVLTFRKRLQDENLALYGTFRNADAFATQLWSLLSQQVTERASAPSQTQAPQGTDETETEASAQATESDLQGGSHAEVDGARRQIAATANSVKQLAEESGLAVEVDRDRFLLIALALNSDGGLLKAHVANRLYRIGKELRLSVMEPPFMASELGRRYRWVLG